MRRPAFTRSFWQTYRYLYGFPWVYRIAALALPLSLAGLALRAHERLAFFAFGVFVLAICAATFLLHAREISGSNAGLHKIKVVPGYLFNVKLPATMAGYTLIRFGERVAAANKEVNALLNSRPLPYRFTGGRYRLTPQLRALAPFFLREARHGGKEIFNGEKVRLDGDITVGSFGRDPLPLEKTDYFSTMLSNDLAAIALRREKERVFDGSEVVTRNGELFLLADSPCSNHIGISVIAFSSDEHLLLTAASARSAQNSGQTTPSATGALSPADFAGDERHELQWALQAAAERELRKEFGLDRQVPIEVRLTGYARLLNRGGKPEFYAVAAVGQPLHAFHVAESERNVLDAVRTLAPKERAEVIWEIERMLAEGTHTLSPALYLSLHFLAPWLRFNEQLFERMLTKVQ